jgi:hypothetical protein
MLEARKAMQTTGPIHGGFNTPDAAWPISVDRAGLQ